MSKSFNVGENNGSAKFNDEQVVSLRKEFKDNRFVIKDRANELGVSYHTLRHILRGYSYGHLPEAVSSTKIPIPVELVDKLRKEYKQKPFNLTRKAKELNITVHYIRKYLKDNIVCCKEAPITIKLISSQGIRGDLGNIILDLRREYKCNPFSLRTRARELGVNTGTLSKALRGIIYKDIPEAVKIIPQPQYK